MASSTTATFVMPGDEIDPSLIPSHKKLPLRLGPGLRHVPPNKIVPVIAGQIITDPKKNTIWVENAGGRYVPSPGDLVIGTVHRSTMDAFQVHLADYSAPTLLPHMAFELASKKNRPQLPPGSLVYARVVSARKHMDAELECVNPTTGKADGLGPLVNGMLFHISLGMSRRLLMARPASDGGVVVLDELGALGAAFETAVGRNGRIWVNSESVKTVIAVGRAIQAADKEQLSVEQQKKLVRKLMKDLS
ncbi:exosome complex exonuclease RRP40 [Sodiomyces alkalinus F11]|uniref:Ribosomal RNA-processing protein 40 n=1 Tax=Sodiomyces alkalinus (strain CBS 110278 / VKM F-3762 / F11) TaxID=1314773 RepID=A0A3N2PJP7_SODAK|nr:exosome complex exonuclease RRP40 [Sodiomyces alkalinus F11]ROT34752.1 exosome complex exonuclease RRP40 [Sodiomyces alkalinus F11]